MRWLQAVLLLSVLLLDLGALAGSASAFEVEGSGRARAVAGDIARARAQALDRARGEAVERALGLALGAGEGAAVSPASGLRLADEARYVRALRVVEEQRVGDEIVLRVAVVCDMARLRRDGLALLRSTTSVAASAPNPRVGVFAEVEGVAPGGRFVAASGALRRAAIALARQHGLLAEALPGASWLAAQRAAAERELPLTLRLGVRLFAAEGRLAGLEWPLVRSEASVRLEGSLLAPAAPLVQQAVAWGAAATLAAARDDAALAAAVQALRLALAEAVARSTVVRRPDRAAVLHLRSLASWSAYEQLCSNLRQQAVGLRRCDLERVALGGVQLALDPAPAGTLLAALLAASELGRWTVRIDDVQPRELWATLIPRAPAPGGIE